MIASWRGFYGVLAVAAVAVIGIYIFGTRPLIQRERDVDARLADVSSRLSAVGLGATSEEVERNIERVRVEIQMLAELSRDPSRTIEFSPEMQEILRRQPAVLDFEERRYLVADRLIEEAADGGVALFEELEDELPTFRQSMERTDLLLAQLTVIEQLVTTAIRARVGRIDSVRLVETRAEEGGGESDELQHEIPVRIRITGSMNAVRSFLASLPLTGDELRALGHDLGPGTKKSAFYISRFIFRKSSRERADEVELDLIASGFLDLHAVQ